MSFKIVKILSLPKVSTKLVNYFGLELEVSSEANYIATDSDGWVYSYIPKPALMPGDVWDAITGSLDALGTIEFEGDFKDSLVYVGEAL